MLARLLAAVLLFTLPLPAMGAEVIVINGDPPGVGFNDPAPATPIGGNPGSTVGQQALNVFQFAADRWGANLISDQPIRVLAFFTPLACTPTSGVLGAAGAYYYFANVPAEPPGKALVANIWYPAALAEKITNQDIVVDPTEPYEIIAVFNSQLGRPGCLTGNGWYYGLDNQQPANRIDLLAVVLHEFGHGLGFSASPTNTNTGARPFNFPSVWENVLARCDEREALVHDSNRTRGFRTQRPQPRVGGTARVGGRALRARLRRPARGARAGYVGLQ